MDIPDGFIDVSTSSDKGVLKKIIKEGFGEATPKNGAVVYVHYVGTFVGGEKDGQKFDSSRDRDSQFSFTLGEGQVIKAWDVGVTTMKKGEMCELICAPAYAYGDKETGTMPANSTLKFEVELFDWKGKDISPHKDGSILQTIIVSGTGYDSPKECVSVKISIKGFHNGDMFDERDVEFEIGDYDSYDLILGIEMAVRKMKKHERSLFEIKPEHAFGSEGNVAFNIPPNVTINYEITLTDFEKIKESYSVDSSKDKLVYSENFKLRATDKFQSGKYLYASKLYGKAAGYIEYDTDFTEEEDKVARVALLLSLRLNLALCHLKLGDSCSAITESDKALQLDPASEKGLYRLGQALILKGDYEEARRSLKTLLAHHGTNKQALIQLKLCDTKIREDLNLEKKLYQTMLSKLGQVSCECSHVTDESAHTGDTCQHEDGQHTSTEGNGVHV